MGTRLPLIIILGATGSGKTKLSLELAQKFRGEIIGADSMQLYKGLDIITAKATKDEQTIAPHHLIDVLEPHEISSVVDYRNKALNIIDNLLKKNKLPIIVGGTNYYIESILWKILIEEPGATIVPFNAALDHELASDELHKKLVSLDPQMAKRLHPNNKRKILRSLEVLKQKGKKMSDILREQQTSKGGTNSGGGLRYPNAIIFKLQCEQEILDDRLNDRVDSMVQQGLIDELTNFHRLFNEYKINGTGISDYTKGIFQAIGFKEFHSYLLLNSEERQSIQGHIILKKCIDELKTITRRYARKQKKWVTNRFLGRAERELPPMYGLDTTNISQWVNNVTIPATEIIECYIFQHSCKYERLSIQTTNSTPNAEDETFICDVCQRIFIGIYQWNIHRKSNRHKKMLEKKTKLAV